VEAFTTVGNAVPIISVLAGAAVAILVPLITAAAHSSERRREYHRERVTRLRDVLVKCCFCLADASTAAVSAARMVGVDWEIEADIPGASDAKSSYAIFRDRLLDNYRTHLVLALELGPDHSVSEAFGEAADVLVKLQRPLVEARETKAAGTTRADIRKELYSYGQAETRFQEKASKLLIEEERVGETAFSSLPNPLRRSRARTRTA
jgi:hypothetical protein